MTACNCLAAAALFLSGSMSACHAVTPATDTPRLAGTAWVLEGLPGHPAMAGHAATLQFANGHASGSDGCNRYSRTYRETGGALAFDAGGATTQKACAPEVMAQAERFTAALTATRTYRIDAGRLLLAGAEGRVLATLAAQSQELVGTSWRVTGYNNGRQAVVSVLSGTRLTMAFATDGRVRGSAGCNDYAGTYAVSGTSLTFGPAATTRRMCARPEVMEQEQQFVRALASVATFRREAERAELRTADGALAVGLQQDVDR